jgi:hypothetical protein
VTGRRVTQTRAVAVDDTHEARHEKPRLLRNENAIDLAKYFGRVFRTLRERVDGLTKFADLHGCSEHVSGNVADRETDFATG